MRRPQPATTRWSVHVSLRWRALGGIWPIAGRAVRWGAGGGTLCGPALALRGRHVSCKVFRSLLLSAHCGHHCQGVARSALQAMHKSVYEDEIPASVARLPVCAGVTISMVVYIGVRVGTRALVWFFAPAHCPFGTKLKTRFAQVIFALVCILKLKSAIHLFLPPKNIIMHRPPSKWPNPPPKRASPSRRPWKNTRL